MKQELKVWCVDRLDYTLQEYNLVRTDKQARLEDVYVRYTQYKFTFSNSLAEIDRVMASTQPWTLTVDELSHLTLCSSKEEAYEYLRSEIQSLEKSIESLQDILKVHAADKDSITSELQKYIHARVVCVDEPDANHLQTDGNEDALIEIENFWHGSKHSIEHLGRVTGHKLHHAFGLEYGELNDETVFVSFSTYCISFYISLSTFNKFADRFRPVAQQLQDTWTANNHEFQVKFVDIHKRVHPHLLFSIEERFSMCGHHNNSYAGIMHSISCQLPQVTANAAKTKKLNKNSFRPTQFVISPHAKNINASLLSGSENYVTMTYVANNKQERYYGLAKPLEVLCLERPNGSVFMAVFCPVENIKSFSREEYVVFYNRSASLLDSMVEVQ